MITTICQMCERDQPLQFHHLIPKKLHSKLRYLRSNTKLELNATGINICKLCHKQLHKNFTHVYLADHMNTLEKILNNLDIQKYLNWAKKQK